MSLFVQPIDFKSGDILISQNDKVEIDLQVTIEKEEKEVLQELFGSVLYDLFIADLDNAVPQDPRFVAVFDEFYLDIDDFEFFPIRSEGIKRMLMWLIYAEFVPTQPFQNTTVGMVRNEEENSAIATPSAYGLASKYNNGVRSYRAIQALMLNDDSLYPEFNGINKRIVSTIL